MTEEQKMIEAWVKKNKPKRYTHGERPEGQDPEIVSPWRPKRKSRAEIQAEKDSERG
tara:strand:+ start:610 stop:780 length:171 start_codon:yes stop_codon:yes gene_type:complete